MSKFRHFKNYRKQYPTASEEVIDALKKSDEKIKYTEYDLKHGEFDNKSNTYKQSREVSLEMIEDRGMLFPDKTEKSQEECARKLGIAVGTVNYRLKKIYKKLRLYIE